MKPRLCTRFERQFVFVKRTSKRTLCYPVYTSTESNMASSVINMKEYTQEQMERMGYTLIPIKRINAYEFNVAQAALEAASQGLEPLEDYIFYKIDSGSIMYAFRNEAGMIEGITSTKRGTLESMYEKGYRLVSYNEYEAFEKRRHSKEKQYICRGEDERAYKVNYDLVSDELYVIKDRTRTPLATLLDDGWRLIPASEGIRRNRALL